MTTAECTSETFTQLTPNCGIKMVWLSCTPVNAADYITLSDYFTTIKGYYLQMTDGSALTTGTFSGAVLTMAAGDTVTPVTGFVWGV